MLIIGHRGAALLIDENTLESLWQGYLEEADRLEFDVWFDRDRCRCWWYLY